MAEMGRRQKEGAGKKRQILHPQMASTARSRTAGSQKLEVPSGFPTRVNRGLSTWVFSHVFPSPLARSWIRRKIDGTQISAQLWAVALQDEA